MAEGDIVIEKIDDDHAVVKVKIETGIVEIQVKNGTAIFAEDGKPSITHDGMAVFTNENGTVHREDGPAVVDEKTGLRKFFLEAKGYSEEEYWNQPGVLNKRKKEIDLDKD